MVILGSSLGYTRAAMGIDMPTGLWKTGAAVMVLR